jgi:chromosome segregation ATPase
MPDDEIQDPVGAVEDDPGAGPPPADGDDPPSDDPEALLSDPDEPPSPDEDDDPEEWRSLEKKFQSIEDERERKREIGKQYWEKTRYASQVRKENEALKAELEAAKAQRVEQSRKAPDAPPPPPHPDLERIDSRINSLSEKDTLYFDEQQKALVSAAECDQGIAVCKAKIEDADEYQRAVLEQRLEGLESRKANLWDRFNDLKDRREELEYKLEELTQQRQWTIGLLDEQGQEQERERLSRESFNEEFPQMVARTIDELADAAGLDPEDEVLRDDLKETVKDRLTVKFWKLGQSKEVDDVDVDELIESEVKRYLKGRDLASRKTFGKTSKEKLAVSGKRPAPAPKAAPKGPRKPPSYADEPKDITALGTVDQSPSMARGRKYLNQRGL